MSNRRAFLVSTAGAMAGTLLPAAAPASNKKAPMSAQAALKELMDGNARFTAGKPRSYSLTARVAELASGQAPFATVLGCSDSRVPVDTVFDSRPGDIFAVRLAGNIASNMALGSIEYAVAELKCPLVMVLGHSKCGAVQAAIELVKDHTTFPGHIQTLAEALAPAARDSEHTGGDWWHNAVEANVRMNVAQLKSAAPILNQAVKNGTVEIIGAVYELGTGKVTLL